MTEMTAWYAAVQYRQQEEWAIGTRNSCCYRIECHNCRTEGPDTIPPRATDGQIVVGESTVSYYIGETARNAYTRSIEHREAVTKLQANNALGKYVLDYHGGKEITLDMWVTSTHNNPLTRQIQKGVSIVTGVRHKCDRIISPPDEQQ